MMPFRPVLSRTRSGASRRGLSVGLVAVLAAGCATPAPKDDDTDTDVVDTDTVDTTDTDPTDTDTVVDTDDPTARRYALGDATVTVRVDALDVARRTYTLTSTAPLRDGLPAGGTRTFTEPADRPVLRTGDLLFDALFAMAVVEAGEDAVASISDGAFANGAALPCDCYQTGEQWHYVWTRDTAYAVDLGLAWLDPARAAASLRFKLSAPKDGGPLQIVQDTGSGGSWPVSTDRAIWALGARTVLRHLDGAARTDFRDVALEAMATTLAVDRDHVFDPTDGLYTGEQSFLDWREQSYAATTATDVVPIATSKALSTNVAHLVLLRAAAALGAETGHPDVATWSQQADDLADAIAARFLVADPASSTSTADVLASLTAPALDGSTLLKRDLLGLSLAVLHDAVPGDVQARVLADYPWGAHGPPVLWPLQPRQSVYHNRATWPFVTAYGALAGAKAQVPDAFERGVEALVQGAGRNLSNMENLELLSGNAWVDLGDASGPVVNSRRQLWSVAGYVGVVMEGLFGLHVDDDGLRVDPFVTSGLLRRWFPDVDHLTLRDVRWRGATFDVDIALPAPGTSDGRHGVVSVSLDGADATDRRIRAAELAAASTVSVTLGPGVLGGPRVPEVVDTGDYRDLWAPPAPSGTAVAAEPAGLRVTWEAVPENGVRYAVYRDGSRVADDVVATTWIDGAATPDAATHCYAVEAYYFTSGLRSHHGAPICWWGAPSRVVTFDAHALIQTAGTGTWSTDHGRPHLMDWGGPDDTLTVFGVRPQWTGPHLLQLVYANGAGPVNTGITCGAKRLTVRDAVTGEVLGEGTVALPQTGTWDRWVDGGVVRVDLEAGRDVDVEVRDVPNMSALEHFRTYTGGLGGGAEPYGFVDVAALKLLPMGGVQGPEVVPAVALDGTDDLAAYAPGQQLTGGAVGARLADDDVLAVDWDEDHLYLSLHSAAFADDEAPWMVYLQAGEAPLAAAVPAEGSTYQRGNVQLPAWLPFTPTHQITLRGQTAFGPDDGPWIGIWKRRAGGGYDQVRRLAFGVDAWRSADGRTLSIAVPRALLGAHDTLRLASHVVWGVVGNEWKDLVPAGHTPWVTSGGSWIEIDLLDPDHQVSAWQIP
ncbi:MAG: esterase [Alphaproteobacteria bacterium]|nr:esterase [Alphaproteobacteria bacterium]